MSRSSSRGLVIGELAREAQVLMARSMRRPISRKRQPATRFMFSCARPDKAASSCKVSSAALRHRLVVRRPRGERARHLGDDLPGVGRQPLADGRSPCAGPRATSDSAEPKRSGLCSASAAMRPTAPRARSARSRPRPPAGAGCARPIAARPRCPCRVRCGGPARAPAAGSPRRARDSGRARTDCRRRGSAGSRRCGGCCTLSLRGQQRHASRPACRTTTQTSAERAPSPIETARASALSEIAAEAAGHDLPAVRRRGREDAQHEGPRLEPAVAPSTGVVESRTTSWPT